MWFMIIIIFDRVITPINPLLPGRQQERLLVNGSLNVLCNRAERGRVPPRLVNLSRRKHVVCAHPRREVVQHNTWMKPMKSQIKD